MTQFSMFILIMAVSAVAPHTKHILLSREGMYQVLRGQSQGENIPEVEDNMKPEEEEEVSFTDMIQLIIIIYFKYQYNSNNFIP